MANLDVNLLVLKLPSKGGKVIFKTNKCTNTIEKEEFVAATVRDELYYVDNINVAVKGTYVSNLTVCMTAWLAS